MYTVIDLFAGAGGFSEGFLQAQLGEKAFDFLLASDINENCELTHLARYNRQLGLDTAFLRMDIQDPSFIPTLVERISRKQVDVVCGGPPCQSFSLAGRRRTFDKKDDLFASYLEVIRQLRPKYFVMENVRGILTKHNGKVAERILNDIRSMIDIQKMNSVMPFLQDIVTHLGKIQSHNKFMAECIVKRLECEAAGAGESINTARAAYAGFLDGVLRVDMPRLFDYEQSKTDERINTLRHGIRLLKRLPELQKLSRDILHEKSRSDIDNDYFSLPFDAFLEDISPAGIIGRVGQAIEELGEKGLTPLRDALSILNWSVAECVEQLMEFADESAFPRDKCPDLDAIHLYNIDKPIVVNAADYGVPQNRERVLFVGCRNDQAFIDEIPRSVPENKKVTVFEAIHDLDLIGDDETITSFKAPNSKVASDAKKYNHRHNSLLQTRDAAGNPKPNGMSYADWCKQGRLRKGLTVKETAYFRSLDAYKTGKPNIIGELMNHKTSKHNDTVTKRLKAIIASGDYASAKNGLKESGVDSKKRNYSVLNADTQAPTVLTIPDDFVHYRVPRAPTVRELARLQSFDDSFVFQGKRSTGGDKRKDEVPQYTLVGNAIPPLVARAIAKEILKVIA